MDTSPPPRLLHTRKIFCWGHNNLETLPNFSPVCPHCRFMLKTNICLLKQLRTQSNHNSNFHFLSRLHKYSFQFQTCNFPVGCFQFVCCRLQLTFATYLALAFLLAASQVLHLPHILLLTRLQNIFLCIFLIFCFFDASSKHLSDKCCLRSDSTTLRRALAFC